MKTPNSVSAGTPRRLIYIDLAYTLRIVRAQRHEDHWLARHSGSYFQTVWGVHPFADVPDGEKRRKPRVVRFSSRQLAVEGSSEVLPLPSWLAPVNFLLSQVVLWRALTKSAAKHRVDAVFANDPLYGGVFALAVARRLRVPLIVFVPANFDEIYEAAGVLGSPRLFRSRKVEQAVMRLVFRRTDMVFAAADSLAAMAVKYGARPDSIARLSHGKFVSSFHLCDPLERASPDAILKKHKLPAASNYLLYVGRHTAMKHPEDALLAMKVVLDHDQQTIGIMAGVGELTDLLKAQALELGISERVVFPGLLDQPELSLLLPHCIFLSPITGIALIEASLAGAPVVAYNRDWQSEFIESSVSGILVPDHDWDCMGRAALDILRDPGRRKRLAHAGRVRALQFVDLESNQIREHAAFDAMFERWKSRN